MSSNLMADISNNNSNPDLQAYRNAGHVIIAVKATEGTGFIDPDHRNWTERAHWQRLAVVHYHFARPDLGDSPDNEAVHFLREALPLAGPNDYLVLDLERATIQGWKHDPAWSQAFDEYVHGHSRFRVILYANRSTLEQSDAWLTSDKKRVWDADWSNDPDFAPPGYTCPLRQFTDGVLGPQPHSLPGIGECDVSRLSPAFYRYVRSRVY